MNPLAERRHLHARRGFLAGTGLGLGALALNALLGEEARAAARVDDGRRGPMHAPRAKHVIYLHMSGAPPQHDLFDPKPKLLALDRTPAPKELYEGQRLAFIRGIPELLASPYATRRVGSSGLEVSELLPHFARIADRVTLVRSMTTEEFNHAPAELLLHTGSSRFGGASLGAWAAYGLGSPNRDLPAFCVLVSGPSDPTGGKSLWGSGFLPSHHQGVRLRAGADPVLFLGDPRGLSRRLRRRSLDALAQLNEREHERLGDPETRSRIEQYELAFRMQASVPEAMDLAAEPAEVHELYGSAPGAASFANHCLQARRLVERGVRFVQLYDWGWDVHGTGAHDDLLEQLPRKCREVDRPVAALIEDLDRRGLLAETLVIFGGEFGRTAMREARNGSTLLGRDHHPGCFSIWLAGGGVARGHLHGVTCDLGMRVTEGEVTVRDLQATILHLLGLDPERLAYPYQGLDQRLIGPASGPKVVAGLLA
jgi:hypothetical protein